MDWFTFFFQSKIIHSRFIDTSAVKCLNESVSGAGVKVFKPWDQRLDASVV